MQLSVSNLFPGHTASCSTRPPNCRSPNLFSAGPPWAPPGSCEACRASSYRFHRQQRGQPDRLRRVRDGRAHGATASLLGRSVVIHWGHDASSEAFPGQPNNRLACGVLRMVGRRFLGDVPMGFLADRRILVTGVLSNRSIAYGIARACQREGAHARVHLRQRRPQGSRRQARRRFRASPGAALRRRARRRHRRAVRIACVANGAASTACCIRSRSRRARRSPATS